MFGFLKRRSRQIFSYFDGSTTRRADPLEVGVKLDQACPKWNDHLKTLAAPDCPMPGPVLDDQRSSKRAATAALTQAVREVCGIKPFTDSEGLTQAETISLLASYLEYMGTLSEAVRPLASWPGADSPSPAVSPILNSAGSGG